MEMIIPPTPNPNGFVVQDDNRHWHGFNGPTTAQFFASQAEAVEAITERGVAAELAVEKTSAATQVNIEKAAAAGILATNVSSQQIQNFQLQFANAASVQAQTFFSATNLAIEKTAAAAQLSAVQNQAAALAQAAECCCELKELIRADGEKTRDLVSSIQASNLAVQLADTKNQILALQSKVH